VLMALSLTGVIGTLLLAWTPASQSELKILVIQCRLSLKAQVSIALRSLTV